MTDTEALQAIAHHLHRIADAKLPAKQALGFGPAPKSQVYVFCNRNHGGIWYSLNSESKAVNIEHPSLTGYIRKLEFAKVQRRGSDVSKLHCTIEADHTYILESAHDSNFSKGLINAIAFLSPAELRQPLTIVPQPSAQTAEVLFCNVYQGDEQVFAPYDDQTDWKLASRAAIDAVKAANPEAAQPTSQAA
jgi:hypothetical protein